MKKRKEITLTAPSTYYRSFIGTILFKIQEEEGYDWEELEEIEPIKLLVLAIEAMYFLGWKIVKEPKKRKKKVEVPPDAL